MTRDIGMARLSQVERNAIAGHERRSAMEKRLTEGLHYDSTGHIVSKRTSPSGKDKYMQITAAGWVDLYANYVAEDNPAFDKLEHIALSPSEMETVMATYCTAHPEMLGELIDRVNANVEADETLRSLTTCPVCDMTITAGETCENCGQTFTTKDGRKLPGYITARYAYNKNRIEDWAQTVRGVVGDPIPAGRVIPTCYRCGKTATHMMASVAGDVPWESATKHAVCDKHIRPYSKVEMILSPGTVVSGDPEGYTDPCQ